MNHIPKYKIQDWLFSVANGKFDIDLGESGIAPHYIQDLAFQENYELNYSIDIGQEPLRRLIADMYQLDHEKILITNGSQEGLYLFYRTLLKPGDHVITFVPGWQQSWEVPAYIGCDVTCIHLDRERQYKIDMDEVIKHIKPETKLISITSPNNPLGTKIDNTNLHYLADICQKRNIYLLNDEEYLINYEQSVTHLPGQTAAVSSLSKIYGYPGLRLGWFIGEPQLVKAMANYKRYTTVTNSSLSEFLALEILKNHQVYLDSYQELINSRQPLLFDFLKKWPQLKYLPSENTPFAYIDLPSGWNSQLFCEHLLKEQNVLLMPAEVFNSSDAIRIAFCRPESLLKEGLKRINQALTSYIAKRS